MLRNDHSKAEEVAKTFNDNKRFLSHGAVIDADMAKSFRPEHQVPGARRQPVAGVLASLLRDEAWSAEHEPAPLRGTGRVASARVGAPRSRLARPEVVSSV